VTSEHSVAQPAIESSFWADPLSLPLGVATRTQEGMTKIDTHAFAVFLLCFVGLCIAFVQFLFDAGLYNASRPLRPMMLDIGSKCFDRISWGSAFNISVY